MRRYHRINVPNRVASRRDASPDAMSSTYLSLHYHLVFSTRNREALISPDWRARLHEYLGGTVRGLGGFPEGVGGVADHVHLLVGLKATHCLSDVMRELKKASSTWVHKEAGLRAFAWQEGYAAFTSFPHLLKIRRGTASGSDVYVGVAG